MSQWWPDCLWNVCDSPGLGYMVVRPQKEAPGLAHRKGPVTASPISMAGGVMQPQFNCPSITENPAAHQAACSNCVHLLTQLFDLG